MAEAFYTGDTFSYSGPVTVKVNNAVVDDLTGWSAYSQLRDESGNLIADLDVEFLSYAPPIIAVSYAESTREWPVGNAKIDIEFHDPLGRIKSTHAATLPIKHDVTRP